MHSVRDGKTIMPVLTKLQRLNGQQPKDPIIIVSGLPRSGTSMMMKILEEGGLPILTDNQRAPDEDNPKGYYELERVKKLRDGDTAWLEDAQGKVVKIISALLEHLPGAYRYKVLFMRRHMPEILASQRQMLVRLGEDPQKVRDEEMAGLFQKHLVKIEAWLEGQPHLEVLFTSYNDILADPVKHLQAVQQFLGERLNFEQMLQVVDKNLYRERRQ